MKPIRVKSLPAGMAGRASTGMANSGGPGVGQTPGPGRTVRIRANRRDEAELQARILVTFGGMPEIRLLRANVGVATPVGRSYVMRFGTPGQADLIGWVRPSGRFLGIEVKAPGGHLRPEQKAWGERLSADGGIYVVARSTDDVYTSLAAAGVVLSMVPPGMARAVPLVASPAALTPDSATVHRLSRPPAATLFRRPRNGGAK